MITSTGDATFMRRGLGWRRTSQRQITVMLGQRTWDVEPGKDIFVVPAAGRYKFEIGPNFVRGQDGKFVICDLGEARPGPF